MSNIREVARHAGVSIATVSRIMNTPEIVSPATRRRIRAAMRAVGYRPAKRGPKRFVYGLIIPFVSNPYYAELADVIEDKAFEQGRQVLFFSARNETRKELQALKECRKMGVDGVFLVPQNTNAPHIRNLLSFELPIVLLTRLSSKFPSVAVDHAAGGRLVAEHLVSLGHQNIAYIGPITDSEDKYMGFCSYLNGHEIELKSEFLFETEDTRNILEEFVADLIIPRTKKMRVSAIFCINDVYAYRVIAMLSSHGIEIPGDVTVVGFDNSIFARKMDITSVSQPLREIASEAYDEMSKIARKKVLPSKFDSVLLTPRLVLRQSSILKRVVEPPEEKKEQRPRNRRALRRRSMRS